MNSYPTIDTLRTLKDAQGARIAYVEPFSAADDAGFEPGCVITRVNGAVLRDIIDWRWQSADEILTLGYIDLDGDEGVIELEREENQAWGFSFEGVIFDSVQRCRNACTFCFMHQLPKGLRESLYVRDDDYRLSFCCGTFVTLTNLLPEDEQRIVEMRLTPLRMSLHAYDACVREKLIGKHASYGMDALLRLLEQGIEFHMQIVLVPGVNDGEVLTQTLEWACAQEGILDICIVPLGYTAHQTRFNRSFNKPSEALELLELLKPFQQRCLQTREHAWVYAADEFYLNAYGNALLEHLPPTEFYGDFSMFEDGVGMVRSFVDDWESAQNRGITQTCVHALVAGNTMLHFVSGQAIAPLFSSLIAASNLDLHMSVLPVQNNFFGGNVDVSGLLCGCDISAVIQETLSRIPHDEQSAHLFAIPSVVFNDDRLTLDGYLLRDIEKATGARIAVVSCNATLFFDELISMLTIQES